MSCSKDEMICNCIEESLWPFKVWLVYDLANIVLYPKFDLLDSYTFKPKIRLGQQYVSQCAALQGVLLIQIIWQDNWAVL